MHYCHPGTHKLFTVYPNGIPMDVLANLLPNRSKWNMNTMLHVHLQVKFAGKPNQKPGSENNFSKQKLEILLKGLESFVQKLSLKKIKTTWDDYYTGTILGDDYLKAKTALVRSFISDLEYGHVIDLGANDGYFSSLFAPGKQVIATDADPNCINDLYLRARQDGRANILPLVIDFTSPSPAISWNNTERESITSRLNIAKNVPLLLIAAWLQPMGEHLIIEFVPKTDEKVKLLLQNRKDIFEQYDLENFKTIFENIYQVVKEEKVGNTDRVLFFNEKEIMKLLKKIPFFLLLLVLFFCLHGSLENYGYLEIKEVLLIGVVLFLSILLCYGILFKVTRNAVLASIVTFFMGLWYFFFGALHDWVKSVTKLSFISSYSFLLPLLLIITVLLFIFLKGKNKLP
ncbi:MAG: hypothetical protein IPG38_09360 [Chitinophagaceae bacterium]|nr:hypothetical protein [Chitinophagaceae bacterium]